ncbi:MAG: Lpg1974 family pore-forming outer membrane protein [Legionella sp.]|nr:Lpg1974 family pore-forming outer membrane protein [Legionella sp.]
MKLTVFLRVLMLMLSASGVFAGTMGTESIDEECRFDGCNHPVWEFGVKALYLNVDYGHDPWVTEREVIDTLTGYSQDAAVLKGYGWGEFADAMYHFAPGKAFDLNLYYLDYTDKKSGLLPNGGLRTVHQRSKWITGNAELHQVLPIADNNAIRVFMGLNYSYITKKRNYNRDIKNLALRNLNSIRGESNGGYYGAGPRWGGHVHYNLPAFLASGFSVYGEGAAGLLIGQSHAGVVAVTQPQTVLGSVNRKVHQFSVVFEFDAKLGANYTHATRFGLLGAELGWMVFDYLSAIEDKANAESSDVLYQGFYAGVKWQGDLA